MIAHHFHRRTIPDEVCPPEGPGIHWQGVGFLFAVFSVGRMPISVGLWFLSQQRLMKHETMKNLMKHGEFVVCLHSHQLIHGDVFACFF